MLTSRITEGENRNF